MRAAVFLVLSLIAHTWAEGELSMHLDTARNRMRCLSDSECLNEKGVLRLLRAKDFQSIHAEDLSTVLAHHFLHGDASCTVQLPSLEIVELEVMRAIETEDIPGILRTFKRILKDGEKKECITTDTILREMTPTSSSFTAMQWVRSVLAILMDHVLKGYCLDDGVPSGDSLDNLFHRYGDVCSPYITAKGLAEMMSDLESIGNAHDHNHNHDNHHHEGHSHHECDHHHHDSGNHDHDHHYSGKYHGHDHDHLSHNNGNHDHSDHYDPKHNYSDHHDHNHSDHDHNDHSLSNHDHSDHNHSDHDHGHYLQSKYIHGNRTDGNHSHNAHDHSNHDHSNHNLSNHGHNDHDHSEHDHGNHNLSNHGHIHHDHSDQDHTNPNLFNTDQNKHNHTDHDHSNHEIKLHPTIDSNNYKRNYSDSENGTMESESKSSAVTGSYPEVIEEVFTPKLSNLWHPTTLASEESNVVSNIIPPLSTPVSSITSQCLSAESLVSLYGSDRITISKSEFLRLCPVIVQQTVGEVCAEPHVPSNVPSKIEVYGYGSACVAGLCLASLSGVLLLPLMRRNARHYVIAGFQGLALSTLASDALLHLLPECLGLHSHDHSHGHSHDHSFPQPYAQMMLAFLATTYVLFMTEAVLCALSGRSKDTSGHGHGHGHSHVHHISEPTLISIKNKSTTQLPISGDQSCSSLNTEILDMDTVRKPPNLMVSQPVLCGLTSVALVVTLGDALHNFGDGMAIGAAFSASLSGGLSTAAAAFCHELPHELGDFVVLLSTGLSFSRALWLNFLSGLTCFAGLYVGILVGDNEVTRKWVMAVTASTFLYVALAEMVPELREHRYGSPFKMLLVKNIGIIAGVTIMCIISVYEEDIA